MHVGTQMAARDDSDYQVWAQLGVTHVCADPPGNPHDWTLDVLERHKAKVESFGLSLDMVQLPLGSRPIEESQSPDILLAGPERDRQIDSICALIRNLARAGIPAAKYNMNLIGIPRTESEAGRGGSRNSTFRWAKADQDAPPGLAGVLDADDQLGADRLFPGAGRAGRRGAQGAARLPPARPLHAARLQGRHPRAWHGRWPQALRLDAREPLSRPQLLPGHGRRDAGRPGQPDLRCDPLVRRARQAVQRPFPQHQGPQARLHGGVPGRGRHGHVARAQGLSRRSAIPTC